MVLVNKVYQRKWDLGIDLVQAAFSVGKQGIPNRFPLLLLSSFFFSS